MASEAEANGTRAKGRKAETLILIVGVVDSELKSLRDALVDDVWAVRQRI